MSNQELKPIEDFRTLLTSDKVQTAFGAVLPKDIDHDKFTAVVVRAIQEDPALLEADRKSLMLACQDAAKDGLMPDKREGALVVRSTKVNNQYVKKVTWQPMIGGLRKNLARAGFDIRAEVVYEHDTFDQDLGDSPAIIHKRPRLGDPRGEVIGAYAIATRTATGEKYREVMSYVELEKIRSNAQGDFVWKAHTSEMYRKTVARRLVKFLPITGDEDEILQSMMERDNSNFVHPEDGASDAAKSVQEATRSADKPAKSNVKSLPKVKTAPKVVSEVKPPPEKVEVEAPEPEPDSEDNDMPETDTDDPGF